MQTGEFLVEVDKLCERSGLSETEIANCLAQLAIFYAHGAEETIRQQREADAVAFDAPMKGNSQ